MRRAVAAPFVPLLLALTLAQQPATANSITTIDTVGGSGPLGLTKVETGHAGLYPKLTITFDKPIRPRTWGPKDFVVVDIDTDGKGASEAWVFVTPGNGRLFTSEYDPRTKWWDYSAGRIRRVSPRSIELRLDAAWAAEGHFYAAGSYRKDGGRCSRGCWDTIPNRGYLVHDSVPPSLATLSFPQWALSETVRIAWRHYDRGFSKLQSTTLSMSDLESGVWRPVATAHTARRQVRDIPAGEEGAPMLFRVSAVDGNGNRSESGVLSTAVPYDQENAGGDPLFLGLWLEEENPDAYGGTVRTSTTTADAFTFGGEGDQFCVILRASEGEASFSLDGGGGTTGRAWGNLGNGFHLDCIYTTYGDHTAELEVVSGELMVDAYWVGLSPEARAREAADPPDDTPIRATRSGRATTPLTELLEAAGARRG
ncbi:MAG: hypothetical protein M3323_14220 [Actinomycetota bacterium]|nr:hypothetical protein [Actinomycetota bacterium]